MCVNKPRSRFRRDGRHYRTNPGCHDDGRRACGRSVKGNFPGRRGRSGEHPDQMPVLAYRFMNLTKPSACAFEVVEIVRVPITEMTPGNRRIGIGLCHGLSKKGWHRSTGKCLGSSTAQKRIQNHSHATAIYRVLLERGTQNGVRLCSRDINYQSPVSPEYDPCSRGSSNAGCGILGNTFGKNVEKKVQQSNICGAVLGESSSSPSPGLKVLLQR